MRRLLLALGAVLAAAAVPAPASAAFRAPCAPGGPTCTFWNAKVAFVADGDTIRVRVEGSRKLKYIRFVGINAMELQRYSKYPSRRRGDCHGLEATAFIDRYITRTKRRVRLSAQRASSSSGHRLYRSVWVKVGGRWRDLARMEIKAGHALWLPNGAESAHNREYAVLASKAIAAGKNLYDPDACGAGPDQAAPLSLSVKWDADGVDDQNINDEWVEIRNGGPRAVSLAGWWIRDSWLRPMRGRPGFVLPARTVVPARGRIRVHSGCGTNGARELHWCQRRSIYENTGDGAYLFDPQGDLRTSFIFPCVVACSDPLRGKVRISARPRRPESISITNVSGAPVDLGDHIAKLRNRGRAGQYVFGRTFAPGTILGAGDTLDFEPGGNGLSDNLGVVELRTMTDVETDCFAWGSARC